MRFVSASEKMGIQPTKYPLGILLFFVNAAALCVYKLRFECGVSTWERAGVPGH